MIRVMTLRHWMIRGNGSRRTLRLGVRAAQRYLSPLAVLGILILVWYAVVSIFHIPGYIVPTPLAVLRSLVNRGWSYLPDAWTTTQEILAGFGLGFVIGLPLAGLISQSRTLRRALYPVLISSQMIPIFAIAAVVTIVFSYGLLPQIVVAALYSFFPIVVNGADGLSGVDPELVNLLKSAGASEWRIFRTVRVPSALPSLFSASKLAITFAVTGAVIGEWIGGQSGLGYLMRFQNDAFDVSGMFATVVVLSVLGVLLFASVSLAEYVLLPWHRDEAGDLGDLWRARSWWILRR